MKTIEKDGELFYYSVKFDNQTYRRFETLSNEEIDKNILDIIDQEEKENQRRLYHDIRLISIGTESGYIGFFELLRSRGFDREPAIVVLKIWIKKEYRNLGYGTQIFRFIHNWYEKKDYIRFMNVICPIDLLPLIEEYGLNVHCHPQIAISRRCSVHITKYTALCIQFVK